MKSLSYHLEAALYISGGWPDLFQHQHSILLVKYRAFWDWKSSNLPTVESVGVNRFPGKKIQV